jgi:PAS domain S-box-containing protein
MALFDEYARLSPQLLRLHVAVLVALTIADDTCDHVLESIAVALCLIDQNGIVLWGNGCARALLGDVAGERIDRIVVREQIGEIRQQLDVSANGQAGATSHETVLLDLDGWRVPVRMHLARVTEDGQSGWFTALIPLNNAEMSELGSRRALATVSLTSRQRETLMLLGDGLGTTEIATSLGISVQTARNHIRGVLRALGAHTRVEAVAVAHRTGLLYT